MRVGMVFKNGISAVQGYTTHLTAGSREVKIYSPVVLSVSGSGKVFARNGREPRARLARSKARA